MTTSSSLRIGEAILGAVVLGLGLFIAVETSLLDVAASNAAIGPRLFPFLIAAGLLIVGALVLRQAFFGHIAHEEGGFELDWRAFALVSVGLIVQMVLLETLGWVIATALLFVVATLAFRERRILISIAIGIVLSGLAFWVFNYGLGLTLPTGSVFEQLMPDDEEEAE